MAQKVSDSELNWFWRYTTKWWFFPVFYVIASILVNPVYFFVSIYYMPLGLLFWTRILNVQNIHELGISNDPQSAKFLIPIHIAMLSLYAMIVYFKYKLGKILKWAIITLMLVIILSFSGCFIGLRTGFF